MGGCPRDKPGDHHHRRHRKRGTRRNTERAVTLVGRGRSFCCGHKRDPRKLLILGTGRDNRCGWRPRHLSRLLIRKQCPVVRFFQFRSYRGGFLGVGASEVAGRDREPAPPAPGPHHGQHRRRMEPVHRIRASQPRNHDQHRPQPIPRREPTRRQRRRNQPHPRRSTPIRRRHRRPLRNRLRQLLHLPRPQRNHPHLHPQPLPHTQPRAADFRPGLPGSAAPRQRAKAGIPTRGPRPRRC